jgi:PLAT/LH2 domain
MERIQKQKFYIVAHNPNTRDDAQKYLEAGVNALEPDVCFSSKPSHPDHYYVSHDHLSSDPDSYDFDHEHSLANYMLGIKDLILRNNYNLALIWFDYKDSPEGNINTLLKIVHDNFTVYDPKCASVAIMVSVAHISDASFVNGYDQSIANAGVAIDQDDNCVGVRDNFISALETRFAYADGIMVGGSPIGIFTSVMKAKALQAQASSPDKQFKMVHTWVLASDDSIRSYLDLHIDGIIVNLSTVPTLISILNEPHYLPMYQLANNGYNPWGAPPIPQYWGTVQTADVTWAGTDALVNLTLTGTNGSLLCSVHGDWAGVLEQDNANDVTWQGQNIGTITSLKAELANTAGSAPDWLPSKIAVGSNLMPNPVSFNFGPNDWVKFGSPVTKLP